MAVDPNVIRKIRRVMYSKDEPASTSVMWAKPEEDVFIYLVFDAGKWQEVGSSEGVIVPEVSVYLSAFTNDEGFIAEGQLPQILAPVAISGDYDDLINKPTIPSNTSDLTNDSKFVSANSQTFTDAEKEQARQNIGAAGTGDVPTLPDNVSYFSDDDGEGIIPMDGIRAESVTSAATMSINPDVVTVINGVVGTAAITLQVPNDNLAHVWDILMTTDSSVAITFAMSNSATILYPDGFSVGASKAAEISVIGVGTKYYLRYGEFA